MTRLQKAVAIIALALCFAGAIAAEFWDASSRQPPADQHSTANAQNSGTIQTAEKPPNITDWLLALFSGLLFGSNVFLWRANNRSASIAERALTELERAFVFIDGFTPEITTAVDIGTSPVDLPERYRERPYLYMHRFAVLPRWKNGGNTPTRNMKIQVNWRGPAGPIPPEYTYRDEAQPFFLGPHAVEHSPPVEMPLAFRIVDYGVHREGVEPMCWIWGRADYEDIFGGPHFVEWCYQPRFDAHDGKTLRVTFIQWGDYNRSDEPQKKARAFSATARHFCPRSPLSAQKPLRSCGLLGKARAGPCAGRMMPEAARVRR